MLYFYKENTQKVLTVMCEPAPEYAAPVMVFFITDGRAYVTLRIAASLQVQFL